MPPEVYWAVGACVGITALVAGWSLALMETRDRLTDLAHERLVLLRKCYDELGFERPDRELCKTIKTYLELAEGEKS